MTETQRFNPYPILHAERIYLRRPTLQDANAVFNWERDNEVWRYDPHRPYSQNMSEFLPVFERNYVNGNGRQFWFIIEDEQHIPIGTITYFNVDYRAGQAEIGLGVSAIKLAGARAMGQKLFGHWLSIFFPNQPLCACMQKQLELINLHGAHSPKQALAKWDKSSIPVAQVIPGYS